MKKEYTIFTKTFLGSFVLMHGSYIMHACRRSSSTSLAVRLPRVSMNLPSVISLVLRAGYVQLWCWTCEPVPDVFLELLVSDFIPCCHRNGTLNERAGIPRNVCKIFDSTHILTSSQDMCWMLADAEEAKRQMDEQKPPPRYNVNPVVETRPSNSRKPPSR